MIQPNLMVLDEIFSRNLQWKLNLLVQIVCAGKILCHLGQNAKLIRTWGSKISNKLQKA